MDLSGISTVPALVRRLAEHYGDAVFIDAPTGTITYREAELRSAAIARGLLASGAGKGTRVGLLMPNSAEWIMSWLGALRIGALVTGLSTFLRPPELAWILRFADINTLLMADAYLRHDYIAGMEEALPELADAYLRHDYIAGMEEALPEQADAYLRHDYIAGMEEALPEQADSQSGRQSSSPLLLAGAPYLRSIWVSGEARPPWCRGTIDSLAGLGGGLGDGGDLLLQAVEAGVHPADEAVIVFTSGSTSRPKGVVHTHGAITRQALAIQGYCDCSFGQRVGIVSPLFWVGGMLTGLLTTMLSGGTVVLSDRPDPESVLNMVRTRDLDYLIAPAGKLRAVADHPGFRPEDFLGLRPSRVRQAKLGLLGPQPDHSLDRFPNSLGMTETFGPHSAEPPGTVLPECLAGSFGRAVGGESGGIERRIVSSETGGEVPPGHQGELLVRGHSVMKGYYKKEREEVFDADGFFHTGDLASIDSDGHLFFGGRAGEMIKTADVNVSPREVELALEALPEVLEAAVLGVPDEIAGQAVAAVVVTAADQEIDEQAVRQVLHRRLSSYKVPRRILNVASEAVPRTSAGDIDKPSLRDQLDCLLAAGE